MTSDFISRRGPVLGSKWGLSCDQPLAAQIGADVLSSGGNAVDAAVAMCAGLCVTQPSSVSLGGDAFCLFYDAKTASICGFNGSGRSPAKLSLDYVKGCGFNETNPIPSDSALSLMVPGLPAALDDMLKAHGSGKFSLAAVLQPSIDLAETGFPVSRLSSAHWQEAQQSLQLSQNGNELLMRNGRAPKTGQIIKLPNMANSLKVLAKGGKEAFYLGSFAEAMADSIQEQGGVLTADDLRRHVTSPPEHRVKPISVSYKGKRVWQMPPNCDGFISLIALNILEEVDMKGLGHNSPLYLHHVVESLRLAFADGFLYNGSEAPPEMERLLSKEYASQRRDLIRIDRRIPSEVTPGCPGRSAGDTVYLSVVDQEGNACSFIATCSGLFGSRIVPSGCGFAIQNRAISFSLDQESRNVLGPSKRSFHTNMPGMVTEESTGRLLASIGVLGYLAQPQGFLQVLLNMLEFGMDPQEALDQCRVCLTPVVPLRIDAPFLGVKLEGVLSTQEVDLLTGIGYTNIHMQTSFRDRASFGRGHVVTAHGQWWVLGSSSYPKDENDDGELEHVRAGVIWCGTDPRGDGQALAR